MTTMVEKVARALIIARFGEEGLIIFDAVPDGFEKSKEATALFAKRIAEARAEARAAIEAMDPDNSMMSTGSREQVCHSWGKNGEFITAESAGDVFTAMMQAALKEGQ